MACRGPRTTTGREGNGTIGGRRNTDHCVATGMVLLRAKELAQPTDSKGGRRANLVADVQGME